MTTIALMLVGLIAPPGDAWPAFLGQGHTPIVAETLPLKWSENENILWSSELPGAGQSSPIIWDGIVYVTSIEGTMKDECHLLAIDLAGGKELWHKSIAASQMVRSNYFQSRSAPTPCADTQGVYVFFETGNLVAFTHAGEPIWERSLTDDYGPFESTIGLAASPIQTDSAVILLIDHEGPSYLLAVSKRTGETLWKTDRDSRVSYSSPALVHVEDRVQLVCSSSGSLDGYDPENGELLWTYTEQVGGNRASTPLSCGNGQFLMAASPGMHNENDAEARMTNGIVRIERTENGYTPQILWRTKEAMPAFNTPTVHGGLAYWVNRTGVLFCFEAETGEKLYNQRLRQSCWATPVAIDDRLYIFGKDGMTSVVKIGREFELLAENRLWDPATVGDETAARRGAADGNSSAEHREHGTNPSRPAATNESSESESKPKEGTTEPDSRQAQPPTPEERERLRVQGENRFADPVQYGVAIVNHYLVIRTGKRIYCIGNSSPSVAR